MLLEQTYKNHRIPLKRLTKTLSSLHKMRFFKIKICTWKFVVNDNGTINNQDQNVNEVWLGHLYYSSYFFLFKKKLIKTSIMIRHITLYVSSTCLFFFLLILASVAYIYLYSQSSLVLEKNILLCLRKIFICLLGYKKKNHACYMFSKTLFFF